MAGLYGLSSIVTGHPLEFMQWLFYLYSSLVVPFYVSALLNVLKPNVLQNAGIVVLFTIDSFMTIFYTLYFAFQWFFNEDVTFEELPGQDYSQSATQAYEYGWIFLSSISVIIFKLYFNLIIISFYKKLLKFNKSQSIPDVDSDSELNLKNLPLWKRWVFKFQYWCYQTLNGKSW